MPALPMYRSKHLIPFAGVLRQQGEPVNRLLKLAGLPEGCLKDPEMLVPLGAAHRFRELAAQRSGLPNIALVATQHLEVKDLGDFGQALLSEPTLYSVLLKLARLVGTETSNLVLDLRLLPNGGLEFCHRFSSDAGPSEWHNELYVLSLMLKIVRLADPAWSPPKIMIHTAATPARHEAIESLGSAACFEQNATGFLVPASMLSLPLTNRTGRHQGNVGDKHLWTTAPAKTYAESLQQMIRSYASTAWLTIEQASEATNISVRTLQRRLSAEQTTYSRVIERTRAEMAGELLERTDASMAEVAHQLGYRNQGDFTRAFHRWAGVSPSQFRRQRRVASTS